MMSKSTAELLREAKERMNSKALADHSIKADPHLTKENDREESTDSDTLKKLSIDEIVEEIHHASQQVQAPVKPDKNENANVKDNGDKEKSSESVSLDSLPIREKLERLRALRALQAPPIPSDNNDDKKESKMPSRGLSKSQEDEIWSAIDEGLQDDTEVSTESAEVLTESSSLKKLSMSERLNSLRNSLHNSSRKDRALRLVSSEEHEDEDENTHGKDTSTRDDSDDDKGESDDKLSNMMKIQSSYTNDNDNYGFGGSGGAFRRRGGNSAQRFDAREKIRNRGENRVNVPEELVKDLIKSEKPLQLLKEKGQEIIDALDDDNKTVLHWAFSYDYESKLSTAVQLALIARQTKCCSQMDKDNYNGPGYPLTVAIRNRVDNEVLRSLINACPSVCVKSNILALALEHNISGDIIELIVRCHPESCKGTYFMEENLRCSGGRLKADQSIFGCVLIRDMSWKTILAVLEYFPEVIVDNCNWPVATLVSKLKRNTSASPTRKQLHVLDDTPVPELDSTAETDACQVVFDTILDQITRNITMTKTGYVEDHDDGNTTELQSRGHQLAREMLQLLLLTEEKHWMAEHLTRPGAVAAPASPLLPPVNLHWIQLLVGRFSWLLKSDVSAAIDDRARFPLAYAVHNRARWEVVRYLLYECPDVLSLHIPLKPKKKVEPNRRYKSLLEDDETAEDIEKRQEKERIRDQRIQEEDTITLQDLFRLPTTENKEIATEVVLYVIKHRPELVQIKTESKIFVVGLPLHSIFECNNGCCNETIITELLNCYPESCAVLDSSGHLPLHRALAAASMQDKVKSSVSIIQKMIDLHPEAVGVICNNKNTALHYAVACAEYAPLVSQLLQMNKQAAFLSNNDNELPLHAACRSNDTCTEIVLALLEVHPEAAKMVDANNNLPLHLAVARPSTSLAVVDKLVSLFPDGCRHRGKHELLPLHIAVHHGSSLDVVNALIQAYPHAVKETGGKGSYFIGSYDALTANVLPFMLAVTGKCQGPVIRRLIELFPAPSVQRVDEGMLPLHYILENHRDNVTRDVVDVLLAADPKLSRVTDKKGRLPLHYAAKGKSAAIVQSLLRDYPEGAKHRDLDDLLPLHMQLKEAHGARPDVITALAAAYPAACLATTTSTVFDGFSTIMFLFRVSIDISCIEAFLSFYPPIYESSLLEIVKFKPAILAKIILRRISEAENGNYSLVWHDIIETSFGGGGGSSDESQSNRCYGDQVDKAAIVDAVLSHPQCVNLARELCYSRDLNGRQAINIVEKHVRDVMLKHLLFCRRFELASGPVVHKSATSIVVQALDYMPQEDWRKMFTLYSSLPNQLTLVEFGKAGRAVELFEYDDKPVMEKHSRVSIFDHYTHKWIYASLKQKADEYTGHVTVLVKNAEKGIEERVVSVTSVNAVEMVEISELFTSQDHGQKGYLTKDEFIKCCASRLPETRKVVLKFMRNQDQYNREIECRGIGFHGEDNEACDGDAAATTATATASTEDSLGNHILQCLSPPDPELFATSIQTLVINDQPMANYKYCMVMAEADRNLDSIRRFERPDTDAIRSYFRDIAKALQALHDNGVMHGDVKLLNAIRLRNKIKLIDLDACSSLDGGFAGCKFSSGILPPEMFAELNAVQVSSYEQYWSSIASSDPELWRKVRPVDIGNGKYIVVKSFRSDEDGNPICTPEGTAQLPYSLVPASTAMDAWSYGVMMFSMFARCPLLLVSDDDDLVPLMTNNNNSNSSMGSSNSSTSVASTAMKPKNKNRFVRNKVEIQPIQVAMTWTSESIAQQLKVIDNIDARDLLMKLLNPNVTERLQHMEEVLEHPFFTSSVTGGGDLAAATTSMLSMMQTVSTKVDTIGLSVEEGNRLNKANQLMIQDIQAGVCRLESLATEMLERIDKTKEVLLKGMIEAHDIIVPSCFVIVNQRLPLPSAESDDRLLTNSTTREVGAVAATMGQLDQKLEKKLNKATKWMDKMMGFFDTVSNPLSVLSTAKDHLVEMLQGDEELYLYLIDEVTMQPVVPRDPDSCYPIVINTKSPEAVERAAQVIPLMKLSLKALSVMNSASGLARCLGYPTPCVPDNILGSLRRTIEQVDQPSSIAEFDKIQSLVLDKKNNDIAKMSPDRVRGLALRQLLALLQEKDPTGDFASLRRIIPANSTDGCVLWTTEEGLEQLSNNEVKGISVEIEVQTDESFLSNYCSGDHTAALLTTSVAGSSQDSPKGSQGLHQGPQQQSQSSPSTPLLQIQSTSPKKIDAYLQQEGEKKKDEEDEEEDEDEENEENGRKSIVQPAVQNKLLQLQGHEKKHATNSAKDIERFEKKIFDIEACISVLFESANTLFGPGKHNVARPRRIIGGLFNFRGKINLRREFQQQRIGGATMTSGAFIVQLLKRCQSLITGESMYYQLSLTEWEDLLNEETSATALAAVQTSMSSRFM